MANELQCTYDDKKGNVLEAGSGARKLWDLWRLGASNKKITLRRLVNVATIYMQWKFFHPKKVRGYPFKLIVDPTSICQLHCALCPTGKGDPARNKGFMDLEKFKKLIDEVAPYTIFVDFFNWGEPFLHKQFPEMVAYTSQRGLVSRISSNLNFLTPAIAKAIVESRPDVLIVSLDGASQETYSQYRKGGDFNKAIENAKLIIEEKTRQKTDKPFMEWQFLVMKQNEHEMEKAKKMAKELGFDKIAFRPVRCDMATEIFMTDEEKVKRTSAWLPTDEKLSRYDYKKKQRKIRYKFCPHLWTKTALNFDGSISPCCAVYNQAFDFGNAFDQGLKAVWNNEKYQRAREIIAKQDRAATDNLICKACLKTGYID